MSVAALLKTTDTEFHKAQLEQSSSRNSQSQSVPHISATKTLSEHIVGIELNFKSNIQSICIEKNYRAKEKCVGEREVEKKRKTRFLLLFQF